MVVFNVIIHRASLSFPVSDRIANFSTTKRNVRTRRDAVLDALGDNATHGVRRTNADKRKAVMTLLEDDEWVGWADSEIARRCCVDHKTVGRYRDELSPHLGISQVTERTYTTKHGTTAVMNTANIGKSSLPAVGRRE